MCALAAKCLATLPAVAPIVALLASCSGSPSPTVREPLGKGTTLLVPLKVAVTGTTASGLLPTTETTKAITEEFKAAGYEVVLSPNSPHDLALTIDINDGEASPGDYKAIARWSVVRANKDVAKGEAPCALSLRPRVRSLVAWQLAACVVDAVTQSQEVKAAQEEARVAKKDSTPVAALSARPSASATASSPAFQAGTPQRDSLALIVGIERYRDVPRAEGARVDAETMTAVAKRTLGIPADQVRTALDERATRSDIEKNLDWLVENARPNGTVLFFFSGHGAPDPSVGKPYLLPYDGDAKRLDRTALKLEGVLETLAKAKARSVVVMLDSCFSGSGGRSVLPAGTRPLVRVKEVAPKGSLSILSAASGAEISGSASSGDRGLFTSFVVEGLGRAKADSDGDGQITLQELFDYVQPRVTREAKKADRDQTPALRAGGEPSPRAVVLASGLGAE